MPRPAIENTFFQEWSPQMAYVLGFWWADGTMYSPDYNYRIEFTSKDEDHLREIGALILPIAPVRFSGGAWRLTITRKQCWNDLCRHGCIPRKSYGCSWPSPPREYIREFVRGYVDGDGSLMWSKNGGRLRIPLIAIYGTSAFLEGLSGAVYTATGLRITSVPMAYQGAIYPLCST